MPRARSWNQAGASIFTYQKFISLDIVVHAHFISNDGCFRKPGDLVTNVTQINSQSDLISISSFAGPSYLTIRSSLCIILI